MDALQIVKYDAPNCPIYTRNATDLTLFSSFTINTGGTFTVGLENNAFSCLKSVDVPSAVAQLGLLTGLDLSVTPSQPIAVTNIQIFQLYLDKSL